MNKASSVAKGGLFAALSVIMIYLSSLITTNRLFFLGAASLIIPLCIITLNVKYGLLVYLSSSIVSLSLLGPRGTVVSYVLFFGLYGIIKLYIEKLRKPFIEIILKLLFFNTVLVIAYNILRFIIMENINVNYIRYKYIVLIVLEVLFLFYDYILTIFIAYINKRFIK